MPFTDKALVSPSEWDSFMFFNTGSLNETEGRFIPVSKKKRIGQGEQHDTKSR